MVENIAEEETAQNTEYKIDQEQQTSHIQQWGNWEDYGGDQFLQPLHVLGEFECPDYPEYPDEFDDGGTGGTGVAGVGRSAVLVDVVEDGRTDHETVESILSITILYILGLLVPIGRQVVVETVHRHFYYQFKNETGSEKVTQVYQNQAVWFWLIIIFHWQY